MIDTTAAVPRSAGTTQAAVVSPLAVLQYAAIKICDLSAVEETARALPKGPRRVLAGVDPASHQNGCSISGLQVGDREHLRDPSKVGKASAESRERGGW